MLHIHSLQEISTAADLCSSLPNPNTASSINICVAEFLALPGVSRKEKHSPEPEDDGWELQERNLLCGESISALRGKQPQPLHKEKLFILQQCSKRLTANQLKHTCEKKAGSRLVHGENLNSGSYQSTFMAAETHTAASAVVELV